MDDRAEGDVADVDKAAVEHGSLQGFFQDQPPCFKKDDALLLKQVVVKGEGEEGTRGSGDGDRGDNDNREDDLTASHPSPGRGGGAHSGVSVAARAPRLRLSQ
jgi:hypothetical protein